MSLIKSILGMTLALAATAYAQAAKCPSHHGKIPLASVVVFDGPPEQKADLMPDASKGSGDHAYASWDVSYVFEAGRNLFLVCRYGSVGDAREVTVKVEKKVQKCIYRTHKGGLPAEAECK